MALTLYPKDITFVEGTTDRKKIETYSSTNSGSTWQKLRTTYSVKGPPSDYVPVNEYNTNYINGSWFIGTINSSYPSIIFIDEDGNTHVVEVIYYHTSNSTLGDRGYSGIKYYVNNNSPLEKTIHTLHLSSETTYTEYRFTSGKLLVTKLGTNSYKAKLFLMVDKTVRTSVTTTSTELHVINFSVTSSGATYSSIEMYSIANSVTANNYFYVHKHTTEDRYLIGCFTSNTARLLSYVEDTSCTTITTYATGTTKYDMYVTDSYFAFCTNSYGATRPVVYKIASNQWVVSPTHQTTMYSFAKLLIVDDTIWCFFTDNFYDNPGGVGDGNKCLAAGYWNIATNNNYWNDSATDFYDDYHVPMGNSRVGYFIPTSEHRYDEILLSGIFNGNKLEFVGIRLDGDYSSDLRGTLADIMFVRISFVGSAEAGPNKEGGFKTSNKYGGG